MGFRGRGTYGRNRTEVWIPETLQNDTAIEYLVNALVVGILVFIARASVAAVLASYSQLPPSCPFPGPPTRLSMPAHLSGTRQACHQLSRTACTNELQVRDAAAHPECGPPAPDRDPAHAGEAVPGDTASDSAPSAPGTGLPHGTPLQPQQHQGPGHTTHIQWLKWIHLPWLTQCSFRQKLHLLPVCIQADARSAEGAVFELLFFSGVPHGVGAPVLHLIAGHLRHTASS